MAEPAGSPPHKFLVLLVTTAVQTLVTMNVVIPAAMAPEMAAKLGVQATLVGLQIGIAYGGAAALSSVSGVIVRRWGALRASQAALLLAAAGAALMASSALTVIALGAVLCGFGYALTNPPASHLLARVATPADRNFLFSIKQTSVPLGGILAGIMAPPLALSLGPEAPLFVGATAALVVAALMQPLRRAWDRDRDPMVTLRGNPFGDMGLMWHDRRLRLVAFIAFCFAAMQLCLTTFAVSMLVGDLGFGLVEAGIVLAVLQVAGVAGRLWWGWLADRIRDANAALLIVAAISIAMALATTLLGPGTAKTVVYVCLAVFSFAAVGWNGVYMAEIARLAPVGTASAATGAVLVLSFAGILFGPPAFSAVHALVGSHTQTFGIFSLVSLCGFMFVWQLRRRER